MRECDELSITEIVEVLRAKASEYPTQKQAARAMGISEQYLSDMLAGYRSVGPTVAASLGYWRTAVYRKIPRESGTAALGEGE